MQIFYVKGQGSSEKPNWHTTILIKTSMKNEAEKA
jgi:hypothetical protein